RVGEVDALFGWLDSFYRYRSRDLDGSPFYADVAIEYRRRGGTPPGETSLLVDGCSSSSLTLANPSTNCHLDLTLFAPVESKEKATFNVVTADDDWLDIKPNLKQLENLSEAGEGIRSATVNLYIALKPGAELTRTPRPSGFLVEISVGARVYHRRVALSSLPPALADRLELALSNSPSGPGVPISELRLRPITGTQSFYLFVRNPTMKARKVSVQLYAGENAIANGSATLDVKPNSTTLVKFGQPMAPPANAPDAVKQAADALAGAADAVKKATAAPNLPAFQGPLRWRLVDATKTDDILDEKVIPVSIASPREYVGVTSIRFWPLSPKSGQNLLEVNLRALTTPLPPPPCQVKLVLPPTRIPGFISAKDGNFTGVVPPDGGQVLLYASNIQLAEGAAPNGYVYIQVDGQKRAFIFNVTFARMGAPTSPQEDDNPAVRLVAPKFARSSPDYKVGIEVDNAPPGSTLELSLGQKIQGVFTPDLVQQLATPRNRFLGFDPAGKEGTLLFQASDDDWDVTLDTSGIRGQRTLRARLLDRTGVVVREALLDVILDDSPPENVRFVQVPATSLLKGVVNVSATGQDPESGIAKVEFFWGKPINNAMPPKIPTTEGTMMNVAGEMVWSAQVPVQGALPGKNELTVAFTNGVGLVSFATATITLTDGEPNKGPGKIVGVVMEGMRPQPGLTVDLTNTDKPPPKGQPTATTKTKEDGSYEFANLAPGNYSLSCSKESSGRVAKVTVVVPAGQTVTSNLSLYLP
ncbi:MAG: carboxypeptidase regulatory-like domain-containing protein, partial [Gemmataceae bacterium]